MQYLRNRYAQPVVSPENNKKKMSELHYLIHSETWFECPSFTLLPFLPPRHFLSFESNLNYVFRYKPSSNY